MYICKRVATRHVQDIDTIYVVLVKVYKFNGLPVDIVIIIFLRDISQIWSAPLYPIYDFH